MDKKSKEKTSKLLMFKDIQLNVLCLFLKEWKIIHVLYIFMETVETASKEKG